VKFEGNDVDLVDEASQESDLENEIVEECK